MSVDRGFLFRFNWEKTEFNISKVGQFFAPRRGGTNLLYKQRNVKEVQNEERDL